MEDSKSYDMEWNGLAKMASDEKIVETIKFLLNSVKKLSDTFVESEGKVKRGFEGVARDVEDLSQRMKWLERQVEERAGAGADTEESGGKAQRPAEVESQLPVARGSEDFHVPVLNLSVEAIVEIYATTPILLQPFSRACSLTGRTLSGEIDEIELELFSQGSTWVVENQAQGWLLIPRPGSLERKTSLQSLDRLFTIEGVRQLPALLHLVRPAQLDAVVVGRRWQLREKGELTVTPDPLRVGLTERVASLEQRLALLEARKDG